MTDIYEGDPKMVLGPSGSKMIIKGGQNVMDRGVENSISIDLGTKKKGVHSHQNGWAGNHLLRDPNQRIGTDYLETVQNQPITLAGLATNEQAANTALSGKIYGDVETVSTNPSPDTVRSKITVNAPAGIFEFFTEFSQLWKFQTTDPANERI